MLQLRARVDLGVMAMNGYSAFPKAWALLESFYSVSYPGHYFLGGRSYPSEEMQSVYSTAPTDWVRPNWLCLTKNPAIRAKILELSGYSSVIKHHGSVRTHYAWVLELIYVGHVSAPTSTILPTTTSSNKCLNSFSHMIYTSQTNFQILINFWLIIAVLSYYGIISSYCQKIILIVDFTAEKKKTQNNSRTKQLIFV